MGKRLSLLAVSVFLIAGCAGVEITRVKDNKDNGGIRFYRPWPYLLVIQTDKGVEAKTVYLPKKDEEYSIKVKSGLGTVNGSFTLTDGWNLTQFGDSRDSKIPDTITALTGTATSVNDMKGLVGASELPPGLYKYLIDEKTGEVSGLERLPIK